MGSSAAGMAEDDGRSVSDDMECVTGYLRAREDRQLSRLQLLRQRSISRWIC